MKTTAKKVKPQRKVMTTQKEEKPVVQNIFQIAIDGPAQSGKGTNARRLARKFNFLCIDTGALYRGVTIYFTENQINLEEEAQVEKALKEMDLHVEFAEGDTHVFLGKRDVSNMLHDVEVCAQVFNVSQVPKVREYVRAIQYKTAENQPVVIEGRDITSVVFPDALFKFYITASLKERARRRYAQEVAKGNATVTLAQIRNLIYERDKADLEREHSPLKKVEGAIVIDCTRKSPDTVVKMMEQVITKTLS